MIKENGFKAEGEAIISMYMDYFVFILNRSLNTFAFSTMSGDSYLNFYDYFCLLPIYQYAYMYILLFVSKIKKFTCNL